ncbi:MAG: MarR family transcriptional regulator [Solirubrobacteraceae bacterium]
MDDASARPEFEHGTGFLLARLGSLAARSWQAFLVERGLTQIQYATLVVLAEHDVVGQQRLARLVAVNPRNLVAVLDRLAERELIVREAATVDRRRRNVRLAARGVELVEGLASEAAASRDLFLGALSPGERTQLNMLLRSLYESHARACSGSEIPRTHSDTELAGLNLRDATETV